MSIWFGLIVYDNVLLGWFEHPHWRSCSSPHRWHCQNEHSGDSAAERQFDQQQYWSQSAPPLDGSIQSGLRPMGHTPGFQGG